MNLIVACTTTLSQVPYGHCVPEHCPSTVVNPMRLMLLAMVLFGAAPQMIALPAKVVMAFTCVDAMYFLPISLYVNVKVFKKRV